MARLSFIGRTIRLKGILKLVNQLEGGIVVITGDLVDVSSSVTSLKETVHEAIGYDQVQAWSLLHHRYMCSSCDCQTHSGFCSKYDCYMTVFKLPFNSHIMYYFLPQGYKNNNYYTKLKTTFQVCNVAIRMVLCTYMYCSIFNTVIPMCCPYHPHNNYVGNHKYCTGDVD